MVADEMLGDCLARRNNHERGQTFACPLPVYADRSPVIWPPRLPVLTSETRPWFMPKSAAMSCCISPDRRRAHILRIVLSVSLARLRPSLRAMILPLSLARRSGFTKNYRARSKHASGYLSLAPLRPDLRGSPDQSARCYSTGFSSFRNRRIHESTRTGGSPANVGVFPHDSTPHFPYSFRTAGQIFC
jgi:hypothetical protein